MYLQSKITVLGSSRNKMKLFFGKKSTFQINHTIYKVFYFKYYFTHRNVNSQFKNNLCEKGKVDTRTPRDSRNGGGGDIHL